MIVYEGLKSSFINDVNLNLIVKKIREQYEKYFGKPSNSQIEAWNRSLKDIRGVLDDYEIPSDAGVAIEYTIPTTRKRIDFMLSGYSKDNRSSAIIIELKQWNKCEAVFNKNGIVKTFVGHAEREVTHPSYQVMTYANLLEDFNKTIQLEKIKLYPCVFLHNYQLSDEDPICSDLYKEYIDQAPMFGTNDFEKLRNFIKKYIHYGDNKEVLYKIENGKLKPSKRLQDSLAKMLTGNKEFMMIDEQKVIFEDAIRMAIDSVAANEKSVLIVKGGPGTGKSVVAINLLSELINRTMTCFYVTKNSAPRTVFRDKLKGTFKVSYINNLFQGSGQFINTDNNEIDCLIVDEAHRLNAKSGIFQNLGENQVKEIIKSAKFSVFFIDEDQRVTLQDIGTIDEIIKWAKYFDAGYKIVELESQFRCNGSNGYLAWLDNTLEIRKTANFNSMDFDYDFKVIDNPNELRRLIEEKNTINNKSRLVAGYCWDWIKEGRSNTNVHDIVIPEYNFEMSWNLDKGEPWAVSQTSINEVGCIHTCQGLEFEYVGVIVGNDLRYENGKIVTDYTKRASTDQSLKGISKIVHDEGQDYANEIAGKIIKNTYKTLMTRGMKGCYVYCTDKNLQEYLKNKLNKTVK